MENAGPHPVYVLAPGPLGETLRASFPSATSLASPADLRPLGEREAGLVLIERDALPAAEVLELAEEAADHGGGWTLVLARPGEDGVVGRPLSMGWRTEAQELARWASSGGSEGSVLELGLVLDRLARARHDLNNPLTSAMAETQLLLMDAPAEGEAREGLETVEAQLRRIRDMLVDLRTLRRPVQTPD